MLYAYDGLFSVFANVVRCFGTTNHDMLTKCEKMVVCNTDFETRQVILPNS